MRRDDGYQSRSIPPASRQTNIACCYSGRQGKVIWCASNECDDCEVYRDYQGRARRAVERMRWGKR